MLAGTGNLRLLTNPDYLFEPKMDGTRCILVKRGRRVYMFNRAEQDISYIYPHIKRSFERFNGEFVIDGEIICYNERGLPDYRLLMKREQVISKSAIDIRAEAIPATFVAFDVLELNGEALINKQLEERKKILKQLVKEGQHIERILFTDEGNELWELIRKNKMEGVMAKRKGSYYLPDQRSNDWLKIKNGKSIDAVIIGFVEGKNRSKNHFSSLILGLYKQGKLIRVGKVDNGLDDESVNFVMSKIKPLIIKKESGFVKIKPELCCEVDYLELTKEKELRAPVFKRLRHKPADKCTWNQLK